VCLPPYEEFTGKRTQMFSRLYLKIFAPFTLLTHYPPLGCFNARCDVECFHVYFVGS